MKKIFLPLALLTFSACTPERQPLGDNIFIEIQHHGDKYAGMTVHRTAQCTQIKSGVKPMRMTRFLGWFEITKAREGNDQALELASELSYCPKCLNDTEIEQLDDAFRRPIEIVKE